MPMSPLLLSAELLLPLLFLLLHLFMRFTGRLINYYYHRRKCIGNNPRFSSNELSKAPCSFAEGSVLPGASDNSLFIAPYLTQA